jgi:RNA polymerase sigma-70 factor (ECF subfamily)
MSLNFDELTEHGCYMDDMTSQCSVAREFSEMPEFCGEAEEMSQDDFSGLALSHQGALWRAARQLTRSRVAAEDLVQETYLRALRARRTFRLRGFGMRPWLLRIMRNLYLSQRASDARRPAAMPGERLEFLPAAGRRYIPGCSDGARALGALDDMDQEISGAIRDLPSGQRTVLMLWALEGLTYNEVAAAVDAPPGTVMSRLHRARTRLTRRLSAFAAGQGVAGCRGKMTA